ncbi:hypothetical protein VTK26DRAFT_3627 [Humicola hyalothermophila]
MGGPHSAAMMMSRTARYGLGARGGAAYHRGGGGGGGGPGSAVMGPDGKPQPADVYDELDKGLEYVQSMCEHAAHQFLRDGECAEEVANIKRRLAETKELADKEIERVKREEPNALRKPADDELRGRSYRPQSMRKDPSTAAKDQNKPAAAAPSAPAPEPVTPKPVAAASGPLEVDEGFAGEEEEEEEPPKLVYKSTRALRR